MTSRVLGIPVVEGYGLVQKGVKRLLPKFYSLKRSFDDEEDLILEITLKFIEKHYFDKYDSDKCSSKEGFILHGVYTTMVDLVKKQHPNMGGGKTATILYSDCKINNDDFEACTYTDIIPDESVGTEDEIVGQMERDRLMKALPNRTDSKLCGVSPDFGEVPMTLRVIAEHLEAGYSYNDLCSIFVNPKSGKPVTNARLSQLVSDIRKILLDNM